jgi:hypothetical protein
VPSPPMLAELVLVLVQVHREVSLQVLVHPCGKNRHRSVQTSLTQSCRLQKLRTRAEEGGVAVGRSGRNWLHPLHDGQVRRSVLPHAAMATAAAAAVGVSVR